MSSVNPYQAPQARVDDVAEQGQDFVLAERSTRLGATLLDVAMLMVPGMAAAVSLSSLIRGQDAPASQAMFWVIGIAVIAMLGLFITNLLFWHRYGQTIGKRILKIKIVRSDGSRAGLRRIFFRRYMLPGLIGNIPIAGAVFSLVNVLMIFRESRKCLHDNIADTLVIKA